ncbi:MAG: hypothetical protein ACI9LA_000046, partial [Bacteroidia bacterium]
MLFIDVVASGMANTDSRMDWTVKLDAPSALA